MNLIIPMAGAGKRLRPHTFTIPKPLFPIAGKSIVERLIEQISSSCKEKIDTIGFVTASYGAEIRAYLERLAHSIGADARFYEQKQPLGTAHAIHCAQELLQGKVTIGFADTLFQSDFSLDTAQDGIIWTKKVEDPSAFGVVKLDEEGIIVDFIEKPQEFVSDLAIIGIYYVKEGKHLQQAIQYLIDNDIQAQGEYQLTPALTHMQTQGLVFTTQEVTEWLDCGNKNAILNAHNRILTLQGSDKNIVAKTATLHHTILIPPVYIGERATLHNAIIGPHVSIGEGVTIDETRIQNSVVQANTVIKNANLQDAMIGQHVVFIGKTVGVDMGDYSSFN